MHRSLFCHYAVYKSVSIPVRGERCIGDAGQIPATWRSVSIPVRGERCIGVGLGVGVRTYMVSIPVRGERCIGFFKLMVATRWPVSIPVRGERCIVKNAKTGIDNFLLLFNFHYSIETLEKTRKFP